MKDRRIKLKGVGNVRQLGLLSDGTFTIKENCLIRSAHLHRITRADLDELKDIYKLSKVIDLRRTQEVIEKPDRLDDDVEYLHMPIFEEIIAGISHDKQSENKARYDAQDLLDLYCYMVLDEDCVDNISRVLKNIINHDYSKGSVLWHCSEGKDRCGLISALVLYILDFPEKMIVEDYMITNETNQAKVDRLYKQLRENGHSHARATSYSELYLAKREYVLAAYQTILDKYENIDNYITNVLKINNSEIKSFKEKVLII